MKPYLEFERYGDDNALYRSKTECTISGVTTKVVAKGTYRGRHFMIGAHKTGCPVAYLEVLKKDRYIMNEDPEIRGESLHAVAGGELYGGSDYFGRAYWDRTDDRLYIGWQYNHVTDFDGFYPERKDVHKWTITEILMEISQAAMEMDYEEYINKNFRYA